MAAYDGNHVYVAISNLTNRRHEIDLGVDYPAIQRRLYRLNGEIRYEDQAKLDPRKIPIEVEETTVVILTLPEKLNPSTSIDRKHYYSNKTVTKDREFVINIGSTEKLGATAELRIGLQNSRGLDAPIRGAINGHPFEHDTAWGRGVKNFFEQAIIPIPAEHLKTENTITLDHLEDDTTVSEVHLRVDRLEG